MNINTHIKKTISILLCMALILTSFVIIQPVAFAEENLEINTAEASSSESEDEESPEQKEAEARAKKVNKLLKFAYKQKGKPYHYGSSGPDSFDCIGFVYYVFANAGVPLKSKMTKKKSYNLAKNFSKYIVSHKLKDARAGDIIAFYSGGKTKHACIAIGNGKCISAQKNGGVKISKLTGRSGCKVAVIRLI